MKKTLLITLFAALPVLAQDAAPAPAPAPEAPVPARRGEFHKRMLEKFDADKDGKLSDEEKKAMREARPGRGEGRMGRPGHRGPKGPGMGQGPKRDGKPAWGPEGRPSREDIQKKMLEKFDADKDGKLSDDEKKAMREARPGRGEGRKGAFGPKGPKGQGMGQGPKRPKGPGMGQGPKRDGKPAWGPEGRPSREDIQKKMLEKFDTDKDGKLSDDEKKAMRESRPGRGEGRKGGFRRPMGPKGGKCPVGKPCEQPAAPAPAPAPEAPQA